MSALRKLNIAHLGQPAPLAIRAERASDVAAREALLDCTFGHNRQLRTCQRLREGRAPAEGLALSAVRHAGLVGTLRLWHVSAGGVPVLLLGPLAVDPACRGFGIGAVLTHQALALASARGHGAVILRIMVASASRLQRPPSCRCPVRSSASACLVSSCAKARSMAPGE